MSLTVTQTINPKLIWNAFVGAFEGGSNYWMQTAVLKFADIKPEPSGPWYGDEKIYEGGFTFEVGYDDPDSDEGEGNGEGKKLLSYPADVQKGLDLMAAKSPSHFADLIAENDDATTHDVLMQYIVLGEIVYG